ncbi:MAG: hypothetical protein M0002_08795 [Rhodospirillales bacterium]|nr:hypothetical protein [Rhodospirillales bacterium]
MPEEVRKSATTGAAPTRIDWLERVRALAPSIAAAAAESEHERRLPEKLVAELRAAGMFSLAQLPQCVKK